MGERKAEEGPPCCMDCAHWTGTGRWGTCKKNVVTPEKIAEIAVAATPSRALFHRNMNGDLIPNARISELSEEAQTWREYFCGTDAYEYDQNAWKRM